jgi:hypothetical protein
MSSHLLIDGYLIWITFLIDALKRLSRAILCYLRILLHIHLFYVLHDCALVALYSLMLYNVSGTS